MPIEALLQVAGPPSSEASAMAQLIAAIAFLVFVGGQTFFKVLERKERKNGNGNGHGADSRIMELADQLLDLTVKVAGQISYGQRDREDIKALQMRIDTVGGSLREELASIVAKQEIVLEKYDRRMDKLTERVDGLAA